jgi:protein tyrosine phosphatase domain-containing protein 1
VFFYNFGWKDYGEASLTSLLDMVKVVAFAVTEGKVAIHCHAGESTTLVPAHLNIVWLLFI